MARFAGNVHGVVVQISANSSSRPLTGNLTYTLGDLWSAYSTSASASAVRQVAHQYTGFLPRYTNPSPTISANAPMISASYSWLIVRYGCSQSPNTPSRL